MHCTSEWEVQMTQLPTHCKITATIGCKTIDYLACIITRVQNNILPYQNPTTFFGPPARCFTTGTSLARQICRCTLKLPVSHAKVWLARLLMANFEHFTDSSRTLRGLYHVSVETMRLNLTSPFLIPRMPGQCCTQKS